MLGTNPVFAYNTIGAILGTGDFHGATATSPVTYEGHDEADLAYVCLFSGHRFEALPFGGLGHGHPLVRHLLACRLEDQTKRLAIIERISRIPLFPVILKLERLASFTEQISTLDRKGSTIHKRHCHEVKKTQKKTKTEIDRTK